jgi:hypothetical protein
MRVVSLVLWLVVAVGLVVTSVIAHWHHHRLTQVVAAIRSRRIGALLLGLGWAWVGWHFLVR